MALGDVNPSSFEAYEGIRILIPGAAAVGIYAAIVGTLAPGVASPSSNVLAGVVVALFAGLVLLYLDLPIKAAPYLSSDQLPTRELERWDIDPGRYGSHTNLYYLMLDVSFPATIRNRSLYMGSMFRIAFESIYLFGLSAMAVLATTAAYPGIGPSRGGGAAAGDVLYGLAAVQAAVFAAAFVRRVLYRRVGATGTGKALKKVLTEMGDEFALAGVVLLLGTAALYIVFLLTWSPGFCIAAVALSALTWAVMYYRGRMPEGADRRRRLSPPTAVALFAIPTTISAVGAAVRIGPSSPLDTAVAVGWAAISLTAATLIANRGHERKLNGSFAAQTSWMRMNESELIAQYRLW